MQLTKIFLRCLIILIVSGVAYAATSDLLLSQKWYFGILNQEALTLADFKEQKAYFEFAKDNTFTASLGCGQISGTYALTPPNGLELKMVSTTTSATCQKQFMDLETTFINILPKVKFWRIEQHVLYFKANLDDISSIAIFSLQKPY